MSEPASNSPPSVFISYSHDSPVHKKWVGELASKLVTNGVDVRLDQWDLALGDDLVKFMEKGVSDAGHVLMICTEAYVRKADDGTGGVGYEAMIVTGELVKNLGTAKFIPIIRQTSSESVVPKSVGTRYYANLSEGQNFADEYDKLLRAIHKAPALKKPPIGKNPFTEEQPDEPVYMIGPVVPFISNSAEQILAEPRQAYQTASEIARKGDLFAWRRLVRQVREFTPPRLADWRKEYERLQTMKPEELTPMVLKAASAYAPLMSVALAGVESGNPKFTNQAAILDELSTPKEWIGCGLTVVLDVHDAIVFIYQALHGAVCLETGQLPIAIQLARSHVHRRHVAKGEVLYQAPRLVGWPESLGSDSFIAWKFLTNLPTHWSWLHDIFGTPEDFQSALSAYYMALSILELADLLAADRENMLNEREIHLDVPLNCHSFPREVLRKAYRHLLQNPDDLKGVWREIGVEDARIAGAWPKWIVHGDNWLNQSHRFGYRGQQAYAGLFEEAPFRPKKPNLIAQVG